MNTWDRFSEPKLPPKEAFYSKLSDAHISDEDYTHAQRSGRPLGARPWETTATCTVAPTSCSWQMSLRRSGRRASASTAQTPHTTTPARAFYGTPYSKRQEMSSSCSHIMTSTCSSRRECVEASQWSQSAMPKPTILWSMVTTQESLTATSST